MPPETGRIPSDLLRRLEQFREETARRENGATNELVRVYRRLHDRLNDKLEDEVRRIFAQPERLVTHQYITERITALMGQVEEQLRSFENHTERTVDARAQEALTAGARQALAIMQALAGRSAPIVELDFNRLNPAQLNTIVGFLSPGSPLRNRIHELARHHSPAIRDQLIEGIALGYNPNKVARTIAPLLADVKRIFNVAMARPLADAVRMARTSALYTHREAAHANYQANSDVVTGWQWFAHLGRACVSCMVMHGSIHSMSERLNDHYCGRCTQLPIVYDQALLKEGAGKEHFNKLSPEKQQELLGRSAYKALKDGRVQLDQFSAERFDRVYGTMRGVPSLRSLIGPQPAPPPKGVPKPPRAPRPARPTRPASPPTQPQPPAAPSGATVSPPKPPKGITAPPKPAKPVTKPPKGTGSVPKPPRVPKPKPAKPPRVPRPAKPKPIKPPRAPRPPKRVKQTLIKNQIKYASGARAPQQVVAEAVEIMQNVLRLNPARVANMPPVLLKSMKLRRNRRGEFNYYTGQVGGMVIGVSPSLSTTQKHLTTWHELGHYFDKTYFRDAKSFGFESDAGGARHAGELADWWRVNPNAYRQTLAEGITVSVDRSYLDYTSTPREVFARSFAQYVAYKSGNHDFIKNDGPYPVQWERSDFDDIFKELDKLFG
jgi:hypothetical protein